MTPYKKITYKDLPLKRRIRYRIAKIKRSWIKLLRESNVCLKCLRHVPHTLLFFLFLAPAGLAMDNALANRLADAIYIAEGADRAVKPYGILSVPCNSHQDCRQICLNTIKNNHKRWLRDSKGMTYLEYLAHRYAPVGANDLNRHWLSNVQKIFYRGTK